MLLVSFKYIKRPQEDYENIYISKPKHVGFTISLEKEWKEVSETLKEGIVSFDKLLKTSLINLLIWTKLSNV